jgi:hypothetical protein
MSAGSPASEGHVCGQCGVKAPRVDSAFTLFSAQFGWRLHKVSQPDGATAAVWHCPDCWRAAKRESERRLQASRK